MPSQLIADPRPHCPHCGAAARLRPESPQPAAGRLRCEQCQQDYDRAEHSLPQSPPAAPASSAPAPVMPDWLAELSLDLDDEPPQAEAAPLSRPITAAAAAACVPAGAARAERADLVPSAPRAAQLAVEPEIPLLKARASQLLPEAAPVHGSASARPSAASRAGHKRWLVLLLTLLLAGLLAVLLLFAPAWAQTGTPAGGSPAAGSFLEAVLFFFTTVSIET
jgi:hypothetical protein